MSLYRVSAVVFIVLAFGLVCEGSIRSVVWGTGFAFFAAMLWLVSRKPKTVSRKPEASSQEG